jgi:aspartate kinase
LSLIVQKFGGNSLATPERIMAAARRAVRARQAGNQVIVVVSAHGRITDELISLATEICEEPSAREMDMLLSTAGQMSIALMSMAIQALGQPAISFIGAQIGIATDSTHTKARIKNISTQRMRQALAEGKITIVAGFQGIDDQRNITTLGPGGSDTTAVALAAVMKLDLAETKGEVACELCTEVGGVYTTDPRIVAEARKIDVISYDEMLELASIGADVVHPRSIAFAKKFQVPLQIRSSFSDEEGTWILPEADWMHNIVVCGAAIVRDEARVMLDRVPDEPGVSHCIFSAIAEKNIVVDLIAQNAGSAGRASIGFTVLAKERAATLAVLGPLAADLGAIVHSEDAVSKVSVVGTGMRTNSGVAQQMFAALAAENIDIKMITTGDIKISVLVNKADGVRTLRAVHEAFKLHEPRPGAGLQAPSGTDSCRLRPAVVDEAPLRCDLPPPTQQLANLEDFVIHDIALDTEQGRITVFELPDRPDRCWQIFERVAADGIVVDMIVKNLVSSDKAELSFTLPRTDLARALTLIEKLVHGIDPATRVLADADTARLCVFGVGVRMHTSIARRMLGALARKGINISMINTSEVCLSLVVESQQGESALAALKQEFDMP